MRYFKNEEGELLTLENIRQTYNELKADGDLQDYEDFNYYLQACMYYNNGTLTELSEDDICRIDVTTVYYTEGKYGECQHTGKHYSDYIFHLRDEMSNGEEIKWKGVNGVIVNEDDNRIFQASGYTHERGLFCDLY